MKNPKIGERVRAYDNDTIVGGYSGSITKVDGDCVFVNDIRWFDRRQCVRLAKKKYREFWIARHFDCNVRDYVYLCEPAGTEHTALCHVACRLEFTHVKEVRKK